MKKWIQQHADTFHRSTESMKSFYNRIHGMYWVVERYLGPCLNQVTNEMIPIIGASPCDTALEYCCGSGMLSAALADHFSHLTAKDLSVKMLTRARKRTRTQSNVSYEEGDILRINDAPHSYDFAFVSFGLHLFSPEHQKRIIGDLLQTVRKEVIIIEHLPKWEFVVALAEWMEGSHYNEFIRTEWRQVASELNAHFERKIICNMQVQRWRLKP